MCQNLLYLGGKGLPVVGRSGPKPSCLSREPKRCLSLLLPKPLEKAFSQSIFAHVHVSCQKVFIFSVQKMDERGRAQQINFQCRKARAPAVFLLLQPLSQVSLSVTSVLLNSSLSSTLGCTPEGKMGFLLTLQHLDLFQLSLQIKLRVLAQWRYWGLVRCEGEC